MTLYHDGEDETQWSRNDGAKKTPMTTPTKEQVLQAVKMANEEQKEMVSKYRDMEALYEKLDGPKWERQGRTEEQVWGVKNFLTGLGGMAILKLLSLHSELTDEKPPNPKKHTMNEEYKKRLVELAKNVGKMMDDEDKTLFEVRSAIWHLIGYIEALDESSPSTIEE